MNSIPLGTVEGWAVESRSRPGRPPHIVVRFPDGRWACSCEAHGLCAHIREIMGAAGGQFEGEVESGLVSLVREGGDAFIPGPGLSEALATMARDRRRRRLGVIQGGPDGG